MKAPLAPWGNFKLYTLGNLNAVSVWMEYECNSPTCQFRHGHRFKIRPIGEYKTAEGISRAVSATGAGSRRLQKLLALNRVQPTVAMPLPEVACACMLYHISQCFRAGGREKSIAGDAFGRGAPSTGTRVQTPDVIVADFIKDYCDAETVRVASLSSASFSMVICTRISP